MNNKYMSDTSQADLAVKTLFGKITHLYDQRGLYGN